MTAPQQYVLTLNFLSDASTVDTLTPGSDSNTVELTQTFSSGESRDARTPYQLLGDHKVILPTLSSQLSDGSIPPSADGRDSLITMPSTTLLPSPSCYKFAVVCPSGQPIDQTFNLATEVIMDNAPYTLHVSSFPLCEEPMKLVADLPVGTNEDTSHSADRIIDNESLEDYSQWLLQNALVTDFEANSINQKPARKQSCRKLERQRSLYNASEDTFSQQQDFYRPDNFWCPLCRFVYTSSFCPHHPITEHTNPTVTTFARLSKPNCIQLVEISGITRTRLIKRQPALTRFGPLIAPVLTEAEVNAHPDWLIDCPFRLEVFDPESGVPSVRYLRLGNEALCNWMMFVRLVQKSNDQLSSSHSLPNAVAYQQGSDGIFFLTTRQLRSGQELVVTYSPPYAARFGFSHSLVEIDPLPDSRISAIEEDVLSHTTTITKTNKFPDEIHCFVCSLTFTSEDAFRVHCLGHPGEMDQRGISSNTKKIKLFACTPEDSGCEADSTVIEVHKPKQSAKTRCNASANKTFYFQSVLRCSLCAAEVDGLAELVQHTNSQHSMLKPRVFKWEACRSKAHSLENELCDTNWGQIHSNNNRSMSEIPLADTTPAEGLVVVDLGRVSRRLYDSSPYAYGCGQCYQRFPDMHTLEQHKNAKHGAPAITFREDITDTEAVHSSYNRISTNHTDGIRGLDSETACFSTSFESTRNNNSESWNNAVEVISSAICASEDPTQPNVFTGKSAYPSTVSQLSYFECCVCGFEVRTRSALSVHMRSHNCHNDKLPPSASDKHSAYSLPTLCPGTLSSVLRPNEQPREDQRMFFRCRVCGEGQRSQRALREHGLKHQRPSDLMFPCLLCPKELNRAHKTFEQLQRHIRFVHPSQIFPCPYCNSTFGRRKNLNNHLVHHTGRRDFPCPHNGCNKAYSRKDKLKEHLKTHENHPSNSS